MWVNGTVLGRPLEWDKSTCGAAHRAAEEPSPGPRVTAYTPVNQNRWRTVAQDYGRREARRYWTHRGLALTAYLRSVGRVVQAQDRAVPQTS